MKLEKYISDLLYRYDLVIVPEFGGIIGRKKNAHFNRETYIFSPPHKEISFNELLQNNDGLLANYVAETEGISYEQALKTINNEVDKWKKTLRENGRLKLDYIGVFNLNTEQKLFFLPLTTQNYLADAYGLTSFIHKPSVQKQNVSVIKQNIVSVVSNNRKPQPKIVKKRTSKQTNQWWRYAAVLVAGIGLMGGVAKWVDTSSKPQPAVYQKASFVLPSDFPTIVINKPVSEITVTANKKEEKKHKYFIISGAFRNKTNADKKIQELQQKGFKALLTEKNSKGLYMVAYESFSNENDAVSQLKSIKKIQPDAWIFVQK